MREQLSEDELHTRVEQDRRATRAYVGALGGTVVTAAETMRQYAALAVQQRVAAAALEVIPDNPA